MNDKPVNIALLREMYKKSPKLVRDLAKQAHKLKREKARQTFKKNVLGK